MRSRLSEGVITKAMVESREAFEAGCREKARVFSATHTLGSMRTFCVVLGGYLLEIIPSDESLTPHLCRDGFWESWVSIALARYIRPGMRCVDIGANVGYFTLLMADRSGPDGQVLAVEPQQRCADLLQATVNGNRLQERVAVYPVAAGDGTGSEALFLYGDLVGSASLERAKGYQPTGIIDVPVMTVDGMLEGEWAQVDLVKIDAEGAESRIWEGMEWTLQKHSRIAVTVEVAAERSYDLGAFLHRIESDGFPLKVIEEDGVPREWSLDKIVEHGAELPTLWLER